MHIVGGREEEEVGELGEVSIVIAYSSSCR